MLQYVAVEGQPEIPLKTERIQAVVARPVLTKKHAIVSIAPFPNRRIAKVEPQDPMVG